MIGTKFNTDGGAFQDVQIEKPFAPVLHPLPPANQVQMPMPREFNGKLYYGAADVAKIIGVTRQNVMYWHQQGLFTADTRAHDGRYLYEVERVMQLKAVYRANWTRGSYEPPITEATMEINLNFKQYTADNFGNMKITKSHAENLPYELQTPARFFSVIVDKDGKKIPLGKDWCNPKNQDRAFSAAINYYAGFDISGHDIRDDYALLDFDHVLDETTGEFVNADAEKWFNFIQSSFDGYAELSVSGTGIHIFLKPTKSKFGKITNSKGNGVLYFDEPNNIKLEIFYKNAARYCLVTGVPFRCEKCAPIASDDYADEILNTLLAAIRPPSSTNTETKTHTARADLPMTDTPEYDLFRAELMLDVIRPAELGDSDWLAVQSAAKNIGVSYAVLDAFNRRDEKRYSSEENQSRYDSLKDPSFGIETLHGIAKRFGYSEKDSQREWYKLHPNTNPDFDDPEVEAAFRNRVTELAAESEFDAALMKRLEDWQKQNGKINPDTLGELKTAFDALDALTPETFTVADVDKHKHNAALALTYGLRDAAEKYFKTIKAAKEIARNRISESDSDLTKKLSADELNTLTALAEGVDIKTLRRNVDREVTALDKAHKDFIKAENARIAKEKYAKAKELRAIEITNAEERLKQLKAMEPSKERDAELVDVIRQLCEWKHNKYGEPVAVAGTQANAALIFGSDPDLDGLFGFDEFRQADVFLKPAPWKKKAQKGDEWTDRDDAQLRLHIRGKYTEFANKELIADNITKFSDERAFHEVKEYFHNLPKWDGKPRAETLFIDWLKVEDTPFAREVTMKILMAAVARIYYPGCTFQNAVIIHGNQKIGKGYILERLGGKWYKAITDHVDDPHAVDAIRICWIGEFKEMASMRKADVNAIKEFIELSADTRRFAYARRATTVPRHCVFFITVNDDQFLADMTGNRRFWILHSPLPKFGYVKEVRGERLSDDNVIAQIWAEVFAHFKELFKDDFDEKKLVLSTESEFKGEEIAEQYLRDDGLQGEIQAFLDDTKILPPVIWDLLSKEQRRQFVADNGVFAIEEEELAAKFKASRKIIPPELQADFDAAIKPCDFVHRTYARDKKTGEVTTYLKFIGNVYRQHICAAEIRAECFDKSDRRAAPQRINETLTRLEGWSLGKKMYRVPEYGDQKKVYYRAADNVPADDETHATHPTDATNGAPQQSEAVEEEMDLSQWDE